MADISSNHVLSSIILDVRKVKTFRVNFLLYYQLRNYINDSTNRL